MPGCIACTGQVRHAGDGCFMSSHLFLKCSCIALVSGVTAIMPRQNQPALISADLY